MHRATAWMRDRMSPAEREQYNLDNQKRLQTALDVMEALKQFQDIERKDPGTAVRLAKFIFNTSRRPASHISDLIS